VDCYPATSTVVSVKQWSVVCLSICLSLLSFFNVNAGTSPYAELQQMQCVDKSAHGNN